MNPPPNPPVHTKYVHEGVRATATPTRATAKEASDLVRRARRWNCELRATPLGDLTLVRTVHHLDRPATYRHVDLDTDCAARPCDVTDRQADDLGLIHDAGDTARCIRAGGGYTVLCRVQRIPPSAADRLFRRGWIYTESCKGTALAVRVSIIGRLAMAYHHTTRTTAPAMRRMVLAAAYRDTLATY